MHCPELSGLSDAWKKILFVPNEGSFPGYHPDWEDSLLAAYKKP